MEFLLVKMVLKVYLLEKLNNGPAENATAIGFMTLDGNDGSNNTAIGTTQCVIQAVLRITLQ
jgi:hypothetical protein